MTSQSTPELKFENVSPLSVNVDPTDILWSSLFRICKEANITYVRFGLADNSRYYAVLYNPMGYYQALYWIALGVDGYWTNSITGYEVFKVINPVIVVEEEEVINDPDASIVKQLKSLYALEDHFSIGSMDSIYNQQAIMNLENEIKENLELLSLEDIQALLSLNISGSVRRAILQRQNYLENIAYEESVNRMIARAEKLALTGVELSALESDPDGLVSYNLEWSRKEYQLRKVHKALMVLGYHPVYGSGSIGTLHLTVTLSGADFKSLLELLVNSGYKPTATMRFKSLLEQTIADTDPESYHSFTMHWHSDNRIRDNMLKDLQLGQLMYDIWSGYPYMILSGTLGQRMELLSLLASHDLEPDDCYSNQCPF